MSLLPSLRPLALLGPSHAPHVFEAYVDYVCPFSARFFNTFSNVIKPMLSPGGKYDGKVKVVLRLQVQPWHASSTFTHEAAIAVAKVAPDAFWPFSLLLFNNQRDYFDIPTLDMTPKQIRTSLAALASQVLNNGQLEQFNDLLTHKAGPNDGNGVTADLKWAIKYSRQNGVHVTPSFSWDGILEPSASSSWGEKEWDEFFQKKIIV